MIRIKVKCHMGSSHQINLNGIRLIRNKVSTPQPPGNSQKSRQKPTQFTSTCRLGLRFVDSSDLSPRRASIAGYFTTGWSTAGPAPWAAPRSISVESITTEDFAGRLLAFDNLAGFEGYGRALIDLGRVSPGR